MKAWFASPFSVRQQLCLLLSPLRTAYSAEDLLGALVAILIISVESSMPVILLLSYDPRSNFGL